MKKQILFLAILTTALFANAQSKAKVYDENLNPDIQISQAVAEAKKEGKFVVAQLGGNWCKWCVRFARFVENDPEIKSLVDDNFEFIHVNYNPHEEGDGAGRDAMRRALARLGNPVRFGYPVLIVLDSEGKVVHTQDSSFLESGEGYDKEKVERFFRAWTPAAVAEAQRGM